MSNTTDYLKGLQFAQNAIQHELEKLHKIGDDLHAVNEKTPKTIIAKEQILNKVLAVIVCETRQTEETQEMLEKSRDDLLRSISKRGQ